MPTDFSQMQPFINTVIQSCRYGVGRMAERVVTHVQESFPRAGKFQSGPKGQPPAIKSNMLANSMTYMITSPVSVRIGPTIKYGEVHEFGMTIQPRTKKFLRVPVNNAAKTLNAKSANASLLALGKFRIFKSKKGNLIALGQDKVKSRQYVTNAEGKRVVKSSNDQPVFVLKKSVRIPARPFMAPALQWSASNPELTKAFQRGFNEALKASGYPVTLRIVS